MIFERGRTRRSGPSIASECTQAGCACYRLSFFAESSPGKSLKSFRVVSLLEGLSYLLILSVTLGVVSREFVFPLGMAHGVLFIAYLILSLQASHKQGWSLLTWLGLFLASIVPFAFIAVEWFLQRQMNRGVESEEPAV